MKRKHAELIKQWADDDSVQIQARDPVDDGKWVNLDSPTWADHFEYRIKPTKPSIDWSHVADEYVQMATDSNGSTYLHQKGQLVNRGFGWSNTNQALSYSHADSFKSFKAGTCDWKDSLVQRPGVE